MVAREAAARAFVVTGCALVVVAAVVLSIGPGLEFGICTSCNAQNDSLGWKIVGAIGSFFSWIGGAFDRPAVHQAGDAVETFADHHNVPTQPLRDTVAEISMEAMKTYVWRSGSAPEGTPQASLNHAADAFTQFSEGHYDRAQSEADAADGRR